MPWRYLAIYKFPLLLSLLRIYKFPLFRYITTTFSSSDECYGNPQMNIDDCLATVISCPIDFCRDKKINERRSRQQNIELMWLRCGDVRFRTICSWLMADVVDHLQHTASAIWITT